MRVKFWLISGLLAVTPLLAAETAESWSISSGIKYSSGDYGTDYETRITDVPLTLNYRNGAWSLGTTFSYRSLESDGNVTMTPGGVVGGDVSPLGITKGTSKTLVNTGTSAGGVGDLLIEGGYSFRFDDLPTVKIGSIVKIATADETQGLGTGEHDLSFQAGVFDTYGKWAFSGVGGYKITGDPDAITYNDIFYGSVLTSYRLVPRWTLGGGYAYAQALADGLDPQHSVSLFSSYRLSKKTLLGLSYAHGLSDAAAEHSLSALFSFYF